MEFFYIFLMSHIVTMFWF